MSLRPLVLTLLLLGCTGMVSDPGADEPWVGIAPPPADALVVGEIGLRRLSAHEYDNVVRDLFGETRRLGRDQLPEDIRSPFDNRWRDQQASSVLINAAEGLSEDVAASLIADPVRLDAALGCSPSGPTDEACLRQFVEHTGRLSFRRPLSTEEVDALVALGMPFAEQDGDFTSAVDVIVRALLQSPELLYRVEIGTPVEGRPGLYALDGYEVASRLSFLLWGTTPDDGLLDDVAAGMLDTLDGRRAVAARMMRDPRAREQVDRFHAMWIGYETLPHSPELVIGMRTETRALVERVIFDEERSWLDLFTADETYVDDALATHYGLPAPGSSTPTWVDLTGTNRRGILSQGAFLSAAANPGDTSPTKRGILVLEQLLCQTVPPPPPDAPADDPPGEELGTCKEDQYAAHRTDAGCASCHAAMDGIGFGLERFDRAGVYREHDDGRPECVIAGDGEVPGMGTFNGPAELGDLLASSGSLGACVAQHLYGYAMGRDVLPEELPLVDRYALEFTEGGHEFGRLLLAIAGSEAFGYRRDVEEN